MARREQGGLQGGSKRQNDKGTGGGSVCFQPAFARLETSRILTRKTQVSCLLQHAQEEGYLLDHSTIPGKDAILFSGGEHDVWVKGSRVFKALHPGKFGWTHQGPAIPEEYFERMRLFSELFDGDAKFHGVVSTVLGPRIVTSYKLIKATDLTNPHPTQEAIDQFLRSYQFKPSSAIPRIEIWYRNHDSVVLWDAYPRNFIQSDYGPIPVDLFLSRDAHMGDGMKMNDWPT